MTEPSDDRNQQGGLLTGESGNLSVDPLTVGWNQLQAGQVVAGNLELGPLLGRGGMGAVYKVFHREWNRYMALKLPLALQDRDQIDLERWVREAHTWIDLGLHPRVVTCWFVTPWNGVPLLLLDLLSGGSLKERMSPVVAGSKEQWAERLTWLIQLCEGLAHAHACGVVHRDIKPANILFKKDGSIAITDFGLGKAIEAKRDKLEGGRQELLASTLDFERNDRLTKTGAISGTPTTRLLSSGPTIRLGHK